MTRRIVVGVDGSEPATAAVRWAAADARRRGLALRIVHVCEQWPYGLAAFSAEYCAGTLDAAADQARELAEGVEVTTELHTGNLVDELIGESAAADSLVLGSRGLGGFSGMLLGSVGTAVAGHAWGPVVIVRGPGQEEHGRIVVGYDGSEDSEFAMQYAIEQARVRHARLHLLYAWQLPLFSPYAAAYDSLLENAFQHEVRTAGERVNPWREKYPDIEITDEQLCEHPAGALIKASTTADLVVVGSRGLGGFASAVLGSVSRAVLHHATCPVAVVRPHPERP
ncbi:universal stress protein [Nonomuraea sp. NPDC048901]|uniref:universal stress protein n=1 Tax=Nonomuraea sp. NPDC048901 TaxID=3155627 RepID=UPI0034106D1A